MTAVSAPVTDPKAIDPKIIDGKAFAVGLRSRIGAAVSVLKTDHNLTPGLAVVLVGDDPASHVYVRNKAKQTVEVGMTSFEHRLDASVSEAELLALVAKLNADPAVHGILVQLPLPDHVRSQTVLDAILPEKDVDGFHPVNVGRLATGLEALVPCTPLGCLLLLRDRLGSLSGKRAAILGRSNIVGKPMAQLLLKDSCTVTILHSRTRNLPEECKRAEILVAAVGRPEMVVGDWIADGATIIDVGINRIIDQATGPKAGEATTGKARLVGDVHFESAYPRAGAITPVPGGVGPMTIACLLRNTVTAACHAARITVPNM